MNRPGMDQILTAGQSLLVLQSLTYVCQTVVQSAIIPEFRLVIIVLEIQDIKQLVVKTVCIYNGK